MLRSKGENFVHNLKIAEELRDNDFDDRLADDKIGDINDHMKGLFDKLRGVQGKIDRKGPELFVEDNQHKKRKEGINDLMKSLSKMEKKSAFGANEAGQRIYEDTTINHFKRDITDKLEHMNTGKVP